MKRIIAILFALMLVFSLSLTAFAAEVGETDTPTPEISTDEEFEGAEGTEATPEDSPETVIPDATAPETDKNEKFYSGWIDSITSSSLWVSIGSYVLAAIAIIGFVATKFNFVIDLVKSKADTATINGALKDGVKEMREAFDNEYEKIYNEVIAHREKEKQLWSMLTIFMTHTKIPSAAKAEIMKCLTGLKDMSGDIKEIVEQAEKAIAAAEEEAIAIAAPTPALDALVAEKEAAPDYVELG